MSFRTQDQPTLAGTFRRLLPTLERHGISRANVRVQAYLRFLEHFERDDLASYGEQVMLYLRELHEIVFALQLYVGNNVSLPTHVIGAAFDGPPLQTGDAETDRSRNIMFICGSPSISCSLAMTLRWTKIVMLSPPVTG